MHAPASDSRFTHVMGRRLSDRTHWTRKGILVHDQAFPNIPSRKRSCQGANNYVNYFSRLGLIIAIGGIAQ